MEDEQGCSPIHRAIDAAIGSAIEGAAPGVEEIEDEYAGALQDE